MTKPFLNYLKRSAANSLPSLESNQHPEPNRTTFNKIPRWKEENLRRRMSRLQDKGCTPPSTKQIQNSKHRNQISEPET